MTLKTTHPQYELWKDKWIRLDDCFQGQDKIKSEGFKYLPALPSMILDGIENTSQLGYKRWALYQLRANFPDEFQEAIKNYLGLLHQKPPTIVVPPEMEPLIARATNQGESMEALLRRINEYQLRHGRLGLLLDLPVTGSLSTLPYIAVYPALSITNWDDGNDETDEDNLNMVVLDESGNVRDHTGFSWTWEDRFRVLVLGKLAEDEPVGTADYKQALFIGDTYDETQLITPMFKGESLKEIPFQFINTTDITSEPETPPLLGLANLCLSIYMSDADYRQSLYMQGQDTLVVINGSNNGDDKAPQRVGAGARIDVAMGGDAKYVGVQSTGLSEQRIAIEKDKAETLLKSGQMIGTNQSAQESGEAMKTRIAARTASLIRIAYTGAAGLENLLKTCARWMGLDDSTVSVKPNTEFAKSMFSGQDFLQMVTAANAGAPISLQSIHNWLQDQGLTTMSFEDEMKLLMEERKKYPDLIRNVTQDQNPEQKSTESAKKEKPEPKPAAK